jgi:beta-glucan synthesis-associated protein KRE6
VARSFRALYQLSLSSSTKPYFSSSACTCPGEDHPGPSYNKGRGAPEIDVLEAEHNKQGSGGVVSQSAQFAPFSHDYVYSNDTTDEWEVFNPSISRANTYRYALFLTIYDGLLTIHFGAVFEGDPPCQSHVLPSDCTSPYFEPHRQQAVSGLTQLPADVFAGSGGNFHTFGLPSSLPFFVRSHWDCTGFEYHANPQSRQDGSITWQMDGQPTVRMGASAVGPDQGPNGSGVGARLISEEPMVRSYHLFTLHLLILVVFSQ